MAGISEKERRGRKAMKCNCCGVEISEVLINMFLHDGTDAYAKMPLEKLENGDYGLATSENWTGYGLDKEDQLETILCPECKKFPFKYKEIGQSHVVLLTFWND